MRRSTGIAACGWGRVLFLVLPLLLEAAAASPESDYAARAAKLEGKKDAKGWLKLADFAEEIDRADLRDLMELDREAFYTSKFLLQHYAISWAWIHFLFHAEGGEYAPGFRTYLQGVPGKVSVGAFELAVGRLSELEPAFKRYVKETLMPLGEKAGVTP